MIILYESTERQFITLGLGVLRDAISCEVVEELNGEYELEMEYPITGNHYSEIQAGRIILTKSNPYDTTGEPFRIYKITKPINGIVTISAQHISYDLSGYTVEPFKATDLDDTLSKIQNGTIIQSPFTFTRGSDKENVQTEYEIKQPYSQRGLLAGMEGSLLDVYRGEYLFSRFNVTLFNHRGSNRGICIRYGKNMTDVEQEISSEKVYTGVYPYYANQVVETKTEEHMVYEQVYIVAESTAFSKDWFSLSEGPNNKPLLPILHDSPVQCATEGDYYQHIFIWHTVTDPVTSESHDEYVDVTSTAATDYPPNRKSVETYSEESFEYITLQEKVIYINEESEHQNILTLDMTSYFEDVPTEEQLRNRANKYITDNKLGEPTSSVKVSFVKLSDSPEYEQFKNLETVKLGDTIKIEYPSLGVSTSLQVISYNYNAITNLYSEIELGKKSSSISDNVVVEGDNISSLTNDKGFTDETTVNKLIAKMITADYIEALSATFTDVQIKNLLTTDSIRTRIIEASQFDIDYLVAEKLVADDAEIYNQLIAGNIKVRGDIDVLSGSITISGTPETEDAYITSDSTIEEFADGWLCSDSAGTIPIVPPANQSPYYKVKTSGTYYNKIYRYMHNSYLEWTGNTTFEVDRYGNIYANSVELEGCITATSGNIGGCEIQNGELKVPVAHIDGPIYADAIKLNYNETYDEYNVSINGYGINIGITGPFTYNFSVDDDGIVIIKRGTINLGYNGSGYNFIVDDNGEVSINSGSIDISGTIPTDDVYINSNSSVTEFSSLWLCSDSAGTQPITPLTSKYYLIKTVGEYENLIYVWNSSESIYKRSYITPSGVQFSVNQYGQVETNSIVALAGNIGGCEIIDGIMKVPTVQLDGTITANAINLGNGQFEVTTSGEVVIKDGELKLGYNNTFNVYNFEVSDYGIKLGYNTANNTYNFTVNENGEIESNSLSLTGGEINISAEIVVAYIDSTQTQYSSKWLQRINYLGNLETIDPRFNINYKVTTTINNNDTIIYYHWKRISDTVVAYLNPDSGTSYHDPEWLVLNKTDTTPLDPTDYPANTIFEVYRQNGTFLEYASFNTTTELYSTVSETNVLKYVEESPYTSSFEVDNLGNVVANSLEITGGEINLSNGTFRVDRNGRCTASSINISGFVYDPVTGENISNVSLETTDASIDSLTSGNIHVDDLYINNIVLSYDNYSSRESTTIKIDCTAENFKYYDDGFECDLIFGVITDTRWNDTYQGSIFLTNIEVRFHKLNPTSASDYETIYIANITINIANKTTKLHRIMQRGQDNVTEVFFFDDWRCDGKVYGGTLYANCTRAVSGTTSHNVLVIQNKSIFEEYIEAYADPNEVPLTLDWLYYDSNLTELVQPTRNSKYMVHFNATTIKYVVYEGGSYQYIANPPESYDFYGDLMCRDIGNKDDYIQNGYFNNLFVEEYLTISDGKYGNVPDRGSTYQIYPMVYVGGSRFTSQTLIPRVIYDIPLYLIPSGSTFVVSGKVTLLARIDANKPSVNIYSLDFNDDAEIISIQLTICNGDGDASDTPYFSYDDRDYNWYAGWNDDQLYLYSLLESDFDFYYTVICKKN